MMTSSTSASGNCSRMRAATHLDCVSARALPLVPILNVLLMLSSYHL
jgi:hypothetical protein